MPYHDAMHETFEHTADLGLRICAAGLDMLFVEAAQALFEIIVPDLQSVHLDKRVDVSLVGAEPDYLLFDWLRELLFLFDSEHLLLAQFEVRLTKQGLEGTAWGEPIDRARHNLEHEVKAITYHGLCVEATKDGWLAEIIVDI